MKLTKPLGLFLSVCLISPAGAGNPPRPGAIEVGRKAELFLHDDYLIQDKAGVVLEPAAMEKYARNPVMVLDQPWEKGYYLAGCSVMHDVEERTYKMWYDVRNTVETDPDLKDTQTGRCLYAVSKDGLNWTKPVLNAIDWKGSTANNVVFIGPKEKRTKSYWVIKDHSEPDPERRYKMLFHYWDFRGRGVSIATSPDGIHWKSREYTNLQGGFDTLNVLLYDDRIGGFATYLRHWAGGRRHVARSTSFDGFHWSKPLTVMSPDERDAASVDIYSGGAFKLSAASDTYAMLAVAFDKKANTSLTQLAVSRDGIAWHRFREPLIPLGAKGEWDAGLTWGIATEVTIGDRAALYYRGNTMAHGEPGARGITGVGVAMMRPLGFAGWHAASTGVITTRPLLASHARNSFYLNADGKSGSIEVELLDRNGKVIPGFARSDSEPIRANGIKQPVKWKGPSKALNQHILAGSLQLRIHLRSATIYGIGCSVVANEE